MKVEFVGGSRDGFELEVEEETEYADMLISGVPVSLLRLKEIDGEIVVCNEVEVYEMRESGKLHFLGWSE